MRLTTSLTTLTTLALLGSLLTACAGNAPRKPASTEEKSLSSFEQQCYEARQRGAVEPAGCPTNTARTSRRSAPPALDRDSLPLPNLPATALPGGGLLGR